MSFLEIVSFISIIFVLLTSFNLGAFIQYHLKLDHRIPKVALGFFTYLGMIQIISYPLIYFSVNTRFISIIYLMLFLLACFSFYLYKSKIKFIKEDFIKFIMIVISTLFFLIIFSNYGVGARSDSIFYISMVNENSVLESIHNIGFNGNEMNSILYLYQSFYHFFAVLIKICRNIFGTSNSLIYLYIWGAQVIFYFIFFEIVYSFALIYFKRNYVFFFSFIVASVYLCFIDGFFYLALIGNLWRILIISVLLYLYYFYLVIRDSKIFVIMGLLLSALVSVSSSGFYIAFFIAITIFLVILKENLCKKDVLLYCLSLLSPVIYGSILITNRYILSDLFIILILIAYFIGCLLIIELRKYWKQIYACIFFALFSFFIIYSLVNYNKLYSFNYFFQEHLTDMCNQYFSFKNIKQMFFNSFWILLVISMIYLKFKEKNYTIYNKTFVLLILLFLNPLVMPAIIHFITDYVYYRAYDVLFNLFNLALILCYLSKKDKIILSWMIAIQSILIAFSLHLPCENIALGSVRITENKFDRLYKLNENEKEITDYLQSEVRSLPYRPWVISQLPYLKGYVNNIQLKFGISDTREIVKYENKEKLNSSPSDLMNIFIERDFIGQFVFKEEPEFDRACEIIWEEDVKYLVLKKNQFKEKDGTWIPIWLDLRACSETLIQNDEYVLLKRY